MPSTYPNLVFCTLPQEIDGDLYVEGFEASNGMIDVGSFILSQGMIQGLAPLCVTTSVEAGLSFLDSLEPPTELDIAYLDSL
ncbi:hypothetical protein FDG94_gp091 [Pseudomonas phage SM1]|uniref:Uncharacterized protein n=2 Tax=Samunavirus TaxID=2560221 RepID=A0A0U3CC90_9CAUD|nr:hypothetical protein FDG94_gp091 [Pseudomonas phage SM1]ALT58083.1 hypothetical protein SM1_091 [Pseudomonas phage SM1]UGC97069.1 hypothetical protein [Pseudomonas phage BHU-1]UGV19972.1 hypothetical protein [Pseudomonas phage Pa BHU-15]UIW13589.1 hypothetical protein [Pseudomonas phage Pa BHU-17]